MLRGANINGQSIALGGMSALSLVAICGTTTTAQTLLDNGADSNIQMENGKNAYELAKQWNRTEMANILEAYTYVIHDSGLSLLITLISLIL